MKKLALISVAAILLALPGCLDTRQAAGDSVRLTPVFEKTVFSEPTGIYQHPADPSVWFVLEKRGRMVMADRKKVPGSARTVLDLTAAVDDASEGGLLGMAFHPSFASSGEIFVSYTVHGEKSPMVSRLSRFRMEPGGTIDTASEKVILSVDQPAQNHNGGHILFGPDGYLYMGLGDGGRAGDPWGNAQKTDTPHGSILRIDVDSGDPYTVPAANPFAGSEAGLGEIFAWGLRNPWKFSFDRETGALWAGDVGQNAWEEIDIIEKGKNYGWNLKEGTRCYSVDPCDQPSLADPVVEYGHDEGNSVTGGFVYRGKNLPAIAGRYVFGDFVTGRIWSVDAASPETGKTLLAKTSLSIVSFAEDQAGELYVVDFQGKVFRIDPP